MLRLPKSLAGWTLGASYSGETLTEVQPGRQDYDFVFGYVKLEVLLRYLQQSLIILYQ